MATSAKDFMERILHAINDGRVYSKRALQKQLSRLNIDSSYLSLDIALFNLKRAGLIQSVDVTSVQITDEGQAQLEVGFPDEVLDASPAPLPTRIEPEDVDTQPAETGHNSDEVLTSYQSSSDSESKQHAYQIELFAQIIADAGKPLHYTTILAKAVYQLSRNSQNYSLSQTLQLLRDSRRFRHQGDGVFAVVEDTRIAHTLTRDPSQTQPEEAGREVGAAPPVTNRTMILTFRMAEQSEKSHSHKDEETETPPPPATPKRHTSTNPADLFVQILEEAGEPLHCTVIRDLVLAQLPPDQYFSLNKAYVMLRGDRRFKFKGNGVFALAENHRKQQVGSNGRTPTTSNSTRTKNKRADLFAKILAEAGEPLHCTAIHERALEQLPASERFSLNQAYLTLNADPRFKLLAQGVFVLAEGQNRTPTTPISRSNGHAAPAPKSGNKRQRRPDPKSRISLFAAILAKSGKPMHYRDIHDQSLQQLPAEQHFDANLAYISLYSSDRFRLLGDGIFTLREWVIDPRYTPQRPQVNGKPSRAELFAQIIEEAGRPLHFRDIHEQALQRLSEAEHFAPNLAYASLAGSRRFRLLGDGVFTLADADDLNRPYVIEGGQRVFDRCPTPLLPDKVHIRSLFDSVIVGRQCAAGNTFLTVKRFVQQMQDWAGQPHLTDDAIQDALNAWYVLGLCEFVEYPAQAWSMLTLTIDADATLDEVRQHCLTSLAQRLRYTSTILHLVRVIHQATPDHLQNLLRDPDGYRTHISVADYFDYLAAFEAIQRNGDGWRLTAIGDQLLAQYPPENLPDLNALADNVTEAEDADDLDWEVELGLLDI